MTPGQRRSLSLETIDMIVDIAVDQIIGEMVSLNYDKRRAPGSILKQLRNLSKLGNQRIKAREIKVIIFWMENDVIVKWGAPPGSYFVFTGISEADLWYQEYVNIVELFQGWLSIEIHLITEIRCCLSG